MRHLVSLLAQPVDDSLIDAHVGEKPHVGSAELHLLLRDPSRVAERLLDVLALEIGVARENLVLREAATAKNGWRRILARCAPPRRR